jgi:hypothetical protein
MEQNKRHGGAFDRGSADSYYGRPRRPHLYLAATGSSPELTEELMSDEDIEAYHTGYDYNERYGDKKSWD